jgi:hypothetical protein
MAAKKRFHGSYEGASGRRTQEMQDAGMIHENRSAVANMPQEVMYKSWPSASYGMLDSGMNDTISGINNQMREDGSKGKAGMKPHKY